MTPACGGGGVTSAWPGNRTTVPSQRQARTSATPTLRASRLATNRRLPTTAKRAGGTGNGICRHVPSTGCWAGADGVVVVAAAPTEPGHGY
jgi:hypothetical protein